MSQASVLGTWYSTQWGPLTLTGTSERLSGHWDQGTEGTEEGQITAGIFNPETGLLVFAYYQSWNDQHGAAGFILSADGSQLVGSFAQPNGNNGSWILTRNR